MRQREKACVNLHIHTTMIKMTPRSSVYMHITSHCKSKHDVLIYTATGLYEYLYLNRSQLHIRARGNSRDYLQ